MTFLLSGDDGPSMGLLIDCMSKAASKNANVEYVEFVDSVAQLFDERGWLPRADIRKLKAAWISESI